MRTYYLLLTLLIFSSPTLLYGQNHYFPDKFNWETISPAEAGFNNQVLQRAINFAIDNETDDPRDLFIHLNSRTNEPFNEMVGPVKERGEMTGIILKNGKIVSEWGEPSRVDMTFSVTKSFLSVSVGLAYDHGLIESVDDRVQTYVPLEHFNSEHNSKITWDHLLRQTSDWEGTLWGKPDWADRPREEISPEVINRERNEPGTVYKYNDVRVNVLALAALEVWRKPLPMVIKEHVMDKIGASNTWRWHGYENSWVMIDGMKMQSVSGGGHWGGGMWINAYDQARFGYLTLRNGNWDGDQLISEEWLSMARTPTEVQKDYGFMNFFLNTDKERFSNAPESSFFHLGAGANVVYVDPENDLVVVVRWIDFGKMNEFLGLLYEAM